MEHKGFHHIDRLLEKTGRARGRNSENRAKQSLDLLQGQGQIISYWETTREQDKFEGADVVIMASDGSEIPLQIKSSATGARAHGRKFPNVPCLVVTPLDTEAIIKDKIISLLKTK